MRFRVVLVLAALAATLLAPVARAADAAPDHSDAVVVVGRDVSVDRPVDRIVVVGGDVRLGPSARVDGDVIVLFGKLQRSPAAQVGGSEYVLDRDLIDWIPGPGWVAGVLLLVALLVYRIAVWAAVCAIAATLPRAAVFERWTRGWEPRPGLSLAIGIVAVVLVLPALGLLALSAIGLPLALIGLAALLVAAGAGLAMFREGPLWPRRPGRLAYAAYLLLPPALEIGLLITAAGGLGAAIRAISRAASSRAATAR
jgi:hypothetical protein